LGQVKLLEGEEADCGTLQAARDARDACRSVWRKFDILAKIQQEDDEKQAHEDVNQELFRNRVSELVKAGKGVGVAVAQATAEKAEAAEAEKQRLGDEAQTQFRLRVSGNDRWW
jgi:hypothetical protein